MARKRKKPDSAGTEIANSKAVYDGGQFKVTGRLKLTGTTRLALLGDARLRGSNPPPVARAPAANIDARAVRQVLQWQRKGVDWAGDHETMAEALGVKIHYLSRRDRCPEYNKLRMAWIASRASLHNMQDVRGAALGRALDALEGLE